MKVIKHYFAIIESLQNSRVWLAMDVGKEWTHVVEVGSYEHFVMRTRDLYIPSKKETLLDYIGDRRAVLFYEQTGTYSARLDELDELENITCWTVNGKRFKEMRAKGKNDSKNDKRDAYIIADAVEEIIRLYDKYLQTGNEGVFSSATYFVRPLPLWQKRLRFYLRYRMKLDKILGQIKNNLEKIAFLLGHKWNSQTTLKNIQKRIKEISEMDVRSEYTSFLRDEFMRYINTVDVSKVIAEIKRIDGETKKILESHPDYEKLKKIKGFGDGFIAVLIATYGDINNFRNGSHFRGYFRIHQRNVQASGKKRKQGWTSIKNALLKKHLYMLVVNSSKSNEEIRKMWLYYRYYKNNPRAKALIKFGSMLLRAIYRYLREDEEFKFPIDNEELLESLSRIEEQLKESKRRKLPK